MSAASSTETEVAISWSGDVYCMVLSHAIELVLLMENDRLSSAFWMLGRDGAVEYGGLSIVGRA
jgi:hypothetical protein